ncbi:MAG: sulfite exporter TauE/SafE family protein [bacterium]
MAFLAAGTVKGTIGVGLPITAVGLMSLFIDPRLAITLMVFPIIFSNVWQLYRSGRIMQTVQKYRVFAGFLLVVLFITTFFTARVSADALLVFVGLVILLFSLINLWFTPPALPDRLDRVGQIIGGITAGITGGMTAMWAPSIAVYLIARKTEKEEFVSATGFLFLIGSVPLCVGFWQNGMMSGPIALVSAGMIVPTLLGYFIGESARKKLNSERFRTAILIFFLLMGLNLVRKGIFG